MLSAMPIALVIWTLVVPAVVYGSLLLLFRSRNERMTGRFGPDLEEVWPRIEARSCPSEGRLRHRRAVARRAHH